MFSGKDDCVRQPFRRSKLVMLGRGRAGKTSTVNSLLSKPFDDKQHSTVGCHLSDAMVENFLELEKTDTVQYWVEQVLTKPELCWVIARQLQAGGQEALTSARDNFVKSISPALARDPLGTAPHANEDPEWVPC